VNEAFDSVLYKIESQLGHTLLRWLVPACLQWTPLRQWQGKQKATHAAGGFEQGDRVGVLLGLYDGSLPFLKNGAPHGSGYAARSAQRRSPSRSSSADVQSAAKAAAAPACVSCQTHSSRAVKPARRAVGTTPS
jgi:hypothetical protein